MHIVDPAYRLAKKPSIKNFGLLPIDAEGSDMNAKAVGHVLSLLDSETLPSDTTYTNKACVRLSRMLGAISSQGHASWFRVSELFGHPSPDLAESMLVKMNELGRAAKSNSRGRFNTFARSLKADLFDEMLSDYLDVASNRREPVAETDWAYIIGSPSERSRLHIGAYDGDILQLVRDLNASRAAGDENFGILGAWLVHDTDEVSDGLRLAFQGSEVDDDIYDTNLGDAKFSIETFLKETQNFVLSPWHVENDECEIGSPAVGMALT